MKTQQEIECTIIVPVYNQCHFTKRCLETIRQHTNDVRYEVIVVDDASTDETAEFLATLQPPFCSIRNDKNLGFIGAVNHGAQEARGKYLLIFNNDTEVHPRWLREMIDLYQSDPSIGIVGAKLLYPDGTIQHMGLDVTPDLLPVHLHQGKPGDDPSCAAIREVAGVTGACLLIERELFNRVGGLERRYEMYYDDIDLCLTVRQMGYRVVLNPRAVVTHYETQSIDNSTAVERSERSYPVFLEKWTRALVGDRKIIGVDVRTLQFSASNMRGIGHYVFHSLEALIKSSPDCYFTLYGDRNTEITPEIIYLSRAENSNCVYRYYDQLVPSTLDVFWLTDSLTPIPVGPVSQGGSIACKPLVPMELRDVTIIANAYDLIPLVFEDQYLKDDPDWADAYKKRLGWLSKHVDHFLALSECTKNDYIRYLEVPEDRNSVMGGGIAQYFFDSPDPDLIATVRSRIRFDGPLILYVGSLDPRKNPEGLLETAQKVGTQYFGDFRLVLAGAAADEEVEKIQELAQKYGVQDKVVMTGFVSPEELRVIQHVSSVFLFPSLYEGFGLPVLEAMAAGIPVVSSNRSSLIEVAGDAAVMCDPNDTDTMAQEIVRLLTDEGYRNKYIQLGKERARQYTWDRVAEKMRQVIASIVHARTENQVKSDPVEIAESLISEEIDQQAGQTVDKSVMEENQTPKPVVKSTGFQQQYSQIQDRMISNPVQLTYEAPMLDISGYASMARNLVIGLDDINVDIRAVSVWFSGMYDAKLVKDNAVLSPDSIKLRADNGEMIEYRTQVDPETVGRILKLTGRPAKQGPESIYVLHHIPASPGNDTCAFARMSNPNHGYYICSTMFETHGIPTDWRDALIQMDETWVPTHFNFETFARAGLSKDRIKILPLGIDPDRYDPEKAGTFPIPGTRECIFLSTFQWSKRKGWDVLLRAYLQAFHPDDDVSLVIRSYYGKSGQVDSLIDLGLQQMGTRRDQVPPIIVLGNRIPDAQMPALYNSCTGFVLPSRGEGWGIPYMESMALGKPCIATDWSGNTEFMNSKNSLMVDYESLKEVDQDQIIDAPIYAGQMLAEPSVDGCAQHMRFIYEHPEAAAEIGRRARQDILENWTLKHQAVRVANRLTEIRDRLRVGKMHPVIQAPQEKPKQVHVKSPMKVLFQNRHNALTHPGGDTEVMHRLQAELESLGVKVNFSPQLQDVRDYDLVHLFNLTILPASHQFAENVITQGKPYVVTSLYEDWPRYLEMSYEIINSFQRYIEAGQDETVFGEEMERLRQLPPSGTLRNDYVAYNAKCHFCCGDTERKALLGRFSKIARAEIVPFAPTLDLSIGDGGTAFRKEFGLDDFILCVGRLESRKNQLMLLKALEHDDIPVVFATGGFTYQPEYEELCKRYQRKEKTLFLDRLPAEMLVSGFQAARLHVLPSWYELPGLVSLEAAAAGTGVAGSSSGALPDYLGDAAHYFSPDNSENIREVILEAWDNPKGDAACEAVRQFTWEESARKTLEIYQQYADVVPEIVTIRWREEAAAAVVRGDLKTAIDILESHRDSTNEDSMYLFQLGEAYAKAGQVQKAKEIMERMKVLDRIPPEVESPVGSHTTKETQPLNIGNTITTAEPTQTSSTEPTESSTAKMKDTAMNESSSASRVEITSPLKVSLFTLKSTEACFYVRLVAPLEELERQGKIVLDYPLRFEGNQVLNPTIPDHTDVAIFQRSFINMDLFQDSIDSARTQGKVVIYEIDDLLINVPDWHPQKDMFGWGMPFIKRHIGMADHVTVSTERLKSNLMEYNPFVTVIPNTVDPKLWQKQVPESPHNGPVVIGYTGTVTHTGDIRTMVPAIEQILERYGDQVVFKFWGLFPQELDGKPGVILEREYIANYPGYIQNLEQADFDIMLVPLAPCEFNECKSSIKWLEYGMAGIPGIYQDLTPYRGVVRHGETGMLAGDIDSWVDCMAQLIDDEVLRKTMADTARNEVLANHTISQSAAVWEQCMKQCLEEKSSPVVLPSERHEIPEIKRDVEPECSIIIPAYNLCQLTKRCLEALYETVDCPCEIIVVDNGSEDITAAEVEAMIANNSEYDLISLSLIRNMENLGFAKACNQGAEAACGKHLIFLNNDTFPQKGWLQPLIDEVNNNPDVGVVGSKLLYPDGTIQHAGIVYSKEKIPFLIYRGFAKRHQVVSQARDIPAVSADCMLVPRDLFRKLGGFDERYKNGFEDADFCLKVAHAEPDPNDNNPQRCRIRYCPESEVVHFEESTPGRKDYDSENMSYFLEKWGDRIQQSDEEYLRADGMAIDWISDSAGRYITLKEKIDRLIREAEDLERHGSLSQALELLDEIVRLDPQRDETFSWMSRIYTALDQLEKAESCLKDAPKTPKTSLALAETKLKRQKIEEAAEELLELKKNIEKLAPEDKSLTWHLLGNCLVHQNRLDEAETHFQEALEADDTWERPHLGLASVCLLRQQFDHAEQHFQRVLERDPSHPKANFGIGMVLWNRGDKEGSLKAYQAVLDKDICHTQALYSLTTAATDMGRWELAAEYLERYVAKNPSHLDFQFSLCGIYYRMGRSGEAGEICNRILQQQPDHAEAKELNQKIQGESAH